MTIPTIPCCVPYISNMSMVVPGILRSDGDTGALALRRRSSVPSAVADITWVMSNNDLALFENFYRVELLEGRRWFNMRLPCAAGIVMHTVRCITPRTVAHDKHQLHVVRTQIEIRERKFTPDDDTTALTCGRGCSTPLFFDGSWMFDGSQNYDGIRN